uniref:Putative secreted peptide n=1 Tax=Anopheles braziliensis TaxID=58242 RepID=A0A2M3ZXS0_9DIPT
MHQLSWCITGNCVCVLSVSAFRCGGGARRVAHLRAHTLQQQSEISFCGGRCISHHPPEVAPHDDVCTT